MFKLIGKFSRSIKMTDKESMNKNPEVEKTNAAKKPTKGRRKLPAISKNNVSTRLYYSSKMHITKMVKDFRFTDPNFGSPAAAIRHYVQHGIQAESATSDVRHALENTTVKNSIKNGLREELKSHTNNIKKFDETMTNSLAEFRDLFADLGRRSTAIETWLEGDTEKLRRQLADHTERLRRRLDDDQQSVVKLLEKVILTDTEALRNIIVLRSIIYVFLLGYQTDKIKDEATNLINWRFIIGAAHEKANALSIDEVKMLAAGTLEAEVIQRMAREIFVETKRHPAVEFDTPNR